METRLASLEDVALLAALHEESFGAACWSLAQIAESLKLDTTAAIIAQEGAAVLGFVLCQIVPYIEAEILTLCIAPSARRKGAGLLLLNAAIAAVRQKKAQRLFLEVAVDNTVALALYKKAGFCVLGKRPGYYKREGLAVDAVMLCLDL